MTNTGHVAPIPPPPIPLSPFSIVAVTPSVRVIRDSIRVVSIVIASQGVTQLVRGARISKADCRRHRVPPALDTSFIHVKNTGGNS